MWPEGEKLGLISGKCRKKGLEQRRSHSNVAKEVPLQTKAIYFGKKGCRDRFLNATLF